MGGACGQGEGLHLTVDGRALLELVDPDSGAPVEQADGATGELVWTHLGREASPLLRYRPATSGGCGPRPARVDALRRASRSTAAATTCCACRQ